MDGTGELTGTRGDRTWRCTDCCETFTFAGEPQSCPNCNAEASWLAPEDEPEEYGL